MSLCVSCGAQTGDGSALCSYHHATDFCAATNRVLCDLLHRHVEPPRLALAEREDLPSAVME